MRPESNSPSKKKASGKIFIYTFLLVITCYVQEAYGQYKFQKIYGNNAVNHVAYHILPADDGYIIEGLEDYKHREILKINGCNQISWVKQYAQVDGRDINDVQDAEPLPGGGYVFVGSSVYEKKAGALIFTTDKDGNIRWAKQLILDQYSQGEFASVAVNKDGNIAAVVAFCDPGGVPLTAVSLFSPKGDLLWMNMVKKDSVLYGINYISGVQFSQGGDLLLSGIINGSYFVSRYNIRGDLTWNTQIDSSNYRGSTAPNPGFITEEKNSGDIFTIGIDDYIDIKKFSKDGVLKWCKRLYSGGLLRPVKAFMSYDNKIIIGGQYLSSLSSANLDGYLLKLDTSGKIIWAREYGKNSWDEFLDVAAMLDSGFIIASLSEDSYYKTFADYVIKTDSLGHSGCYEYPLRLQDSSFHLSTYTSKYSGKLNPEINDVPILVTNGGPISEKYFCTNQVPYVDLGPDTTFCRGYTYTLDISQANPGCHFIWSTGDTTPRLNITQAGTYWVQSSRGGCTFADTVLVNFIDQPHLQAHDTLFCPTDSFQLDAGDSQLVITWTGPDGRISYGQKIWAYDSGLYHVNLVNISGCGNIDTFRVRFYPLPKTDAGPDTAICYGSEIRMQGSGGVSYLWTPARYLDDSVIPNPHASPPKTQKYWLISTNTYGCSDTDTVVLKVKPPLHATIRVSNNDTLCQGESLQALVSDLAGGIPSQYQFNWYTADSAWIGSGKTINFIPDSSTTLYMRMEDQCSPAFLDSIQIHVYRPGQTRIIASATRGCVPATIHFQAVSADSVLKYRWLFSDGATDSGISISHSFLKSGKYTVKLDVTDIAGCKVTIGLKDTLFIWPEPIADFIYNPLDIRITRPRLKLVNTSEYTDSIAWFIDGQVAGVQDSFSHVFPDTGVYEVRLIAYGHDSCAASIVKKIRVKDIYTVHIPNAFTPDGDGLNDRFYPLGTYIQSYDMKIYNRWGELIFNSPTGRAQWDGTYHGERVPEGVYLYQMTIQDQDGIKYYYHGTLQVLYPNP